MVKYIKGDVLNCEATLVAHQVNAFGVMGGGIAAAICLSSALMVSPEVSLRSYSAHTLSAMYFSVASSCNKFLIDFNTNGSRTS